MEAIVCICNSRALLLSSRQDCCPPDAGPHRLDEEPKLTPNPPGARLAWGDEQRTARRRARRPPQRTTAVGRGHSLQYLYAESSLSVGGSHRPGTIIPTSTGYNDVRGLQGQGYIPDLQHCTLQTRVCGSPLISSDCPPKRDAYIQNWFIFENITAPPPLKSLEVGTPERKPINSTLLSIHKKVRLKRGS